MVIGTVALTDTKIAVLNTAGQISISVTRSGDLTSDASLNVLLTGSNFFYPSADAYDDIKIGLSWNKNEGGTKIAVTPIIPSSDKLAYLDIELVDLLRVAPGENINGNVAIYQQGVTPSWIPSAPGFYYQQIQVATSGIRLEVVPISFGTNQTEIMIGATDTLDGEGGTVPKPMAGDDVRFLAGNAMYEPLPIFRGATPTDPGKSGILPPAGVGNNNLFFKSNGTWTAIPSAGIGSIEGVSTTGNIDLIGLTGIVIEGEDPDNQITFSLPIGTSDSQTLIWNQTAKIYEPRAIPSYTGATLISSGTAGMVAAPPAGLPNRYAAADGTWKSEGTIPGQTGGTNGKIVRITATANTWQDAANTDTVDDLYKAGLAFKQGGLYYKTGSTIYGLSGLISGSVYYLDATGGDITKVMPQPSGNTRRVVIGKAIAPDTLIFHPGEVITG